MTTTSPSNPSSAPHGAERSVDHTTGSIARLLKATVDGPSDLPISGIATLEAASGSELTFIRNNRFASAWADSEACAAVVTRGVRVPGHDGASRALLEVDSADLAMNTLLRVFAPPAPIDPPGVHPSAIVDPSVTLGAGVHIGPGCVIGEETVLEDGVVVHANVTLGRAVIIRRETVLFPGVVILDRCEIGEFCILHPNVTIGADGFGFIPAPDGRGLLKVPHIGTVRIGNHVEIGASSCVDRAKLGATTIGDGTKLDNLVQIGHNGQIGRSVVICGLSGTAGSVTIGDGAQLAGSSGVADGCTVGPGVRVAAKAGVASDIPANMTVAGMPAVPHKEYMRQAAILRRLARKIRASEREQARTGDRREPPNGTGE